MPGGDPFRPYDPNFKYLVWENEQHNTVVCLVCNASYRKKHARDHVHTSKHRRNLMIAEGGILRDLLYRAYVARQAE